MRGGQRAELDRPVARLDALVRAAPRTADLHRGPPGRCRGASARAAAAVPARAAAGGRPRPAAAQYLGRRDGHPPGHVRPPRAARRGRGAGTAADAAGRAQDSGRQLARSSAGWPTARGRHDEQLQPGRAGRRHGETPPSRSADERWSRWHAAASELAAQHEAIDLSLEQAQAELTRHGSRRARADRDREAADQAADRLGPQARRRPGAERRPPWPEVREKTTRAGHRRPSGSTGAIAPARPAAAAATRRAARIRPGSSSRSRSTMSGRRAGGAGGGRRRRARPPSLNSALNAFRDFDREVSGQLDVRHTITTTACCWSRSPEPATSTRWPGRPGRSRPGSKTAGPR